MRATSRPGGLLGQVVWGLGETVKLEEWELSQCTSARSQRATRESLVGRELFLTIGLVSALIFPACDKSESEHGGASKLPLLAEMLLQSERLSLPRNKSSH